MIKKNKNKQALSIILLFLTAIIWGFAFVAQVFGSNHVDAYTFNGIRFLLGSVSLMPIVIVIAKKRKKAEANLPERQEKKGNFLGPVICGSMLFIASAFQQYGAQITQSSGRAGFITSLYTVLTPILYFVIFKKRIGINVWGGAILTVIGLFMLCIKREEGLSFQLGEFLLLGCSLFFALHILFVDKFIKSSDPLWFSMTQFFVCGILNLIFAFIFDDISLALIWEARIPILYCGLLSVGVAYTLQTVAQRSCDPTFAAIIMSTEAVFSAVGGVMFGIDNIEFVGYIGCLIIFVGIVISQLKPFLFKRRRLNIPSNS